MDFFNSLSEVAKNRKNFKIWEQDQRDKQAQREELRKRNQYTDVEISEAKQLGERIIDVVDIMDNHSENVAENVETAVQPMIALGPLAATGLALYIFYKTGLIPLKTKGREILNKISNDEKARVLVQDINKERKSFRKSANNINYTYFLKKANVEKIRDPELRKQAFAIHNEYSALLKPIKKTVKRGFLGVVGTAIASFVAANIFAAKLQVDSSKIARFQARKVLEDPKAFVNYTPEQIAEAKKYIEDHPELKKAKKKEKLKSGMIKSIIGILRDRRAYLDAKAKDTDTSQKVLRKLSKEEIISAEKDRDIIQRAVKVMNNEAEKYSENMEVAANVIMGTTPIVGGIVGWILGLVLNKTGLNEKMISGFVNKLNDKEVKEAYEHFRELKSPKDPGYTVRWGKFVEKLMDSGHKFEFDESGRIIPKDKKTIAKEISVMRKKIMTLIMSHKWANSKVLGVFSALVSAIPASLIALNLQKSSARAGRYTAKRELEKEPKNFIGYSDEEYNQVKDIKGKKQSLGENFKEYVMFIPTVLKQYWAYNKYKRNEFKEHQLLTEQLQKLDVTDEQMQDAKNLQRKLFNTFEKVDDNSQLYSESMEAATEIMQPVVIYSAQAVMWAPIIYGVVKIIKGKQSPGEFFVKASEKVANASKLLKSKFFKKYLDSISKAIPQRIGDVDLKFRPIAALVKNIDFKQATIEEVLNGIFKNIDSSIDQIYKMDEYEQVSMLKGLKNSIQKFLSVLDVKPGAEFSSNDEKFAILGQVAPLHKFVYILDELSSYKYSANTRADMLSYLLGKNQYKVNETINQNISQDRIRDAAISIAKLLNTVNEKYLEKSGRVDMIPSMSRYTPESIFSMDDEIKKEIFNSLKVTGLADVKFSEISKLISVFKNMSKEDLKSFEKGQKAITGFAKSVKDPETFSLRSAIKSLKDKYRAKTEEEVNEIMDRLNLGSMDKTKFMKILDNFEKMLDNIPSAEIEKIQNTLLKSFKENPDEFIKLVSSGRICSIFLTPMLVKTVLTAGISWIALNVIVTWLIEAWLADMQLKAGRLGVMKAMESLQDPAYYADIDPKIEQNFHISVSKTNSNLLDIMKK